MHPTPTWGRVPASASNLDIEDDQCEVGYWIATPYWNNGICTEALQAVVDHCFNVKGFSVLWGDYFTENPASGRVMEKCGFVDTGKEALCPGLTADHTLFDKQVEEFEPVCNILVWDAPGHGASRPFTRDFSLKDKAVWQHAIIGQEGIERPVLVGQQESLRSGLKSITFDP